MTKGPKTRIGAWLARPLASFHLVVTIATMLTVLGLVMVLSASSVEQYVSGGSAYSLFTQQLIFAILGAVLFYVALRIPARVLRQYSFPLFVVVLIMLVLVLIPGIGTEAQGARRWFNVGGFSVQPSEIMKVALAIWGAHLVASRRPDDRSVKSILIPLVPAAMLVFALVVAQPNLSTTIALGIIVGALLWFGGLPLKLFGSIAVTGVVVAGVLAMTAGYRSDRVQAFFNKSDDLQGNNYQAKQALYSLADGGFFGRGLGQSVAKWNYLPNAHNDFIFAIIGEELGFVGCAVVIGLFAVFVYTGLRIAARSIDPFWRLLSATATTWIVGQAMINIGYVIGLAAGDRSPVALGLRRRFVLGDHVVHVRCHRQCSAPRARSSCRSELRAGRQDLEVAQTAEARAVPPRRQGAGRSVDRSPARADRTGTRTRRPARDRAGRSTQAGRPRRSPFLGFQPRCGRWVTEAHRGRAEWSASAGADT